MAQNTAIADFTQETLLPIYTGSIMEATILNIPGITVTSGVEITRINQLKGSIALTPNKKTTARNINEASLYSSNNLDPIQTEDFQEIDFDAYRQSAFGSYGSDAAGAFLDGTSWLSDYITLTSGEAALAGDTLLGSRMKVQVAGTDSTDAALRDVVRTPATTMTAGNAIALSQAMFDARPDAVKYNRDSQHIYLVSGAQDTFIRNAFFALDGRQIDIITDNGVTSYTFPNTDIMVVVSSGLGATEAEDRYLFEANNLYAKVTTGMKADFDDKDDAWWARFRFWYDVNFADYTRVVTSVAAAV